MRGTEVAAIHLTETATQARSVFLEDEHLCVEQGYNKGQARSGVHHFSVKYICGRIIYIVS